MYSEAWNKARDIRHYYNTHKGQTYSQLRKGLKLLDSRMEAYGDRLLFVDTDGNYWEDYFSIGD